MYISIETHWKAMAREAMSAGGGGRRKGATQSVGASSGSGWLLLAAACSAIISSSILELRLVHLEVVVHLYGACAFCCCGALWLKWL